MILGASAPSISSGGSKVQRAPQARAQHHRVIPEAVGLREPRAEEGVVELEEPWPGVRGGLVVRVQVLNILRGVGC